MRKNFGGSLYRIEAIKVEAFFIEEAVNLLRIALLQVCELVSEVSNKQTADGVTNIPL